MRKKCILLLILTVFCLVDYAWGSISYQETLLSFYTQQLVSHAAQLFAASIAAFTFITRFIYKLRYRRSRIFFVVSRGVLLGLMIFILFRLLVYGALSSSVLSFPIPERNYNDLPNVQLGNYSGWISYYTFAHSTNFTLDNTTYEIAREKTIPNATLIRPYSHPIWFADFLYNFSGGLFEQPFGLPLCFYLGLFLAYMIYLAFADRSFRWNRLSKWGWFIYLLVPAAVGFCVAPFRREVAELLSPVLTFTFFVCYYVIPLGAYSIPWVRAQIREKLYTMQKALSRFFWSQFH